MCWMLEALTTAHREYQCAIPSMKRHADILLLSGFQEKKNVQIQGDTDKVFLFKIVLVCSADINLYFKIRYEPVGVAKGESSDNAVIS